MRLELTAFALLTMTALAGNAAAEGECPRPGTLGVGRTVEIDTTGAPGFGMEHYKAYDFLEPKEVVLTFDDGPQKFSTEMVLAALAAECTKATFFSIGKMALGYPEIIREVAKAGHTIGTHTWSHAAIAKLKDFDKGKEEIERGFSAVKRAVGGPIAPFFRFPTLVDTQEAVAYLGKRNIAMFSTDIDSFDFKRQTPDHIVKTVMSKLDKAGKGIILMHDIHKTTAKALPALLTELKGKGYKVVHLTAKFPVTTLAEYDAEIEKDAKGLPQTGAERPMSSIVRTVGGSEPASAKEHESHEAPASSEHHGEDHSQDVEPAGEGGLEADKPGVERQKSDIPRPAARATTAAVAPDDVSRLPNPTGTTSEKIPVSPAPPHPVSGTTGSAGAMSAGGTGAAQSAAGPVAAVPEKHDLAASPVVKDASAAATLPSPAEQKAPDAKGSVASDGAAGKKSVSERAKELWRLWFGE